MQTRLDTGADASATAHPLSERGQVGLTAATWMHLQEDRPMHGADALRRRVSTLAAAGADGVYLFNFCCSGLLHTAPGDLRFD